jgi:regulator of protease activity HflC (stomatin/prohibitin superfamily)
MLEAILILVLATGLFLAPQFAIRALARIPFYWAFNPGNTFNIIVTEEDESGSGSEGGGNIVDSRHAVGGARLNKNDPNYMNWEIIEGEEDPEHNTWLFWKLGVQPMGSIFYTTRVNIDRRLRFTREKEEDELHNVNKIRETRNVFYTGELTVVVKEADTADKLGVNFEIDFTFKRQFPVRSVLKLADSAAFLTSSVEKIVNSETVELPAEAYIGGKGTDATEGSRQHREDLVRAIKDNHEFKQEILDAIGFNITAVSLRDVSMTPAHRRLLEMKVEAEKLKEKKIIDAQGDREKMIIAAQGEKEAGILINDKDADRVERVIKPTAETERTTAVRWAEAYEKNSTVQTYAPGKDVIVGTK